jgi:hypothetical protein
VAEKAAAQFPVVITRASPENADGADASTETVVDWSRKSHAEVVISPELPIA